VDKIDENPLTGGASSSLAFIRPLLSDLGILETSGLAFKLFLWDRIESDAREFSRPDRIRSYTLKWTAPQLKTMLSRRLAAHSEQKVSSLASIVTLGRPADIDDLVVNLSGGSPRNIIRICKAIFDQQSELDGNSDTVSERAVLAGIEDISTAIAAETVPENVLRDLAGTQKVQSWQDSGAVIKIGNRQEKKGNRPSNVYAFASPIVLKHVFADMNALDFSERKLRRCECGQLDLRDWDSSKNQSCHACEHSFGEEATG
jgi:hypothetical protein